MLDLGYGRSDQQSAPKKIRTTLVLELALRHRHRSGLSLRMSLSESNAGGALQLNVVEQKANQELRLSGILKKPQ